MIERLLDRLSATTTLVVLLIVMIITIFFFHYAIVPLGGPLLDMQLTLADNQVRLEAMDAIERDAHIWITLVPDTIFPLAYGGFLAGFAARFGGRRRLLIALPALLLILADLAENALILACISGHEALLPLKVEATHVKWFLLLLALALALGSGLIALIRHYAGTGSAREI